MKKDMLTGNYASKLKRKADLIEKKKLPRRIRRVIFFVILILVCAGGILFGALNKSSTLENRYKAFFENPEIASADFELLSYKDVEAIVENKCLGNTPYQSLMGGYFCEKDDCNVYPSENGQSSIFFVNGSEIVLSDSVASDINIRNGIVYYRKQSTRKVYTYEISSGEKNELSFENVGQFALYSSDYIYIDLSKASLVLVDQKSGDCKTLIDSGVKSFAVAGNAILFLSEDHTLYKLGLSDNIKTVIENNISSFSFDGSLWLQNNDKLIIKGLSDNKISDFALGLTCHRLLGITDKFIIFESSDGVYCHSKSDDFNQKLENGIFIGASNEKILFYNEGSKSYSVIDVSAINSKS